MFRTYFWLCGLVFLLACQPGAQAPTSLSASAWEEQPLRYARNFRHFRQGNYQLLEVVQPWREAAQPLRYLLHPAGQRPPQDLVSEGVQPLPYPLQSLLAGGSAQWAFIEALGQSDKIKGFLGGHYLYSPLLQAALAEGRITDLGREAQPDMERCLMLQPQAALVFAMDAQNRQTPQLFERARIPTVYIAEFLEEHPLGRAEWLCFFGILLGQEAEAKRLFEEVVHAYEALQADIPKQGQRPKVLTGLPYDGIWWAAGGQSFLAKLIADAGGDYLWADDKNTGGLPLDPEAVYVRAKEADCWLNVASVHSLAELKALHPRHGDFRALQQGQVYAYDKRVSANGGYDIFESAIVFPHRLLQDLHLCLYPERGDSLFYMRRLD